MKGQPNAPITDPDDVARVVYMMATGISDYMHGQPSSQMSRLG